MNGDPYRSPQPADRRVINRSSPAPQSPAIEPAATSVTCEDASPRFEQPRTTSLSGRADAKKPRQGRSRTPIWIAIIIVAVLIVAGIGWIVWSRMQPAGDGINTSRYQAVYLANGQIYFGKLETLGSNKMRLTNVYYLQTKTDSTTSGDASKDQSASGNFQLIKLRGAVYGPSDEMIISNDQIIYFQNLEENSKASELIKSDR